MCSIALTTRTHRCKIESTKTIENGGLTVRGEGVKWDCKEQDCRRPCITNLLVVKVRVAAMRVQGIDAEEEERAETEAIRSPKVRGT